MRTSIFVLMLFLCLPVLSFAQNRTISNFYNKYKHYDNVTDVSVQGWVIRLAANFAEEEEAKDVLKRISKLRILTMNDGNLVTPGEYKKFVRDVKKHDFEELFTVREGSQHVEFLIREDKKSISNLLMLISDKDEFVLVSLEGNLRFKDLKNIDIDVEGKEHFREIPNKKMLTL